MTPDMMDENGFVARRAVSLWEEGEVLPEIEPGTSDDDGIASLEDIDDEALDEAFDEDDDLDEGFEDEEGD
jgi:hypothetical protein